ncbi:MAG TPA: sigma-70 family RNA polymerase sigma factor [Steroidobacteraceae bacterium]|nr:sigma-70 family RNA polymerase sigma factor [Steroidobacteraceae bacterium]HRX89888.1 sigma-70 family RNA polymerase sigma factor [Steroidobacteraceae bacterium]
MTRLMDATPLSDNDLIRLTADGEVRAFECLYRRYEKRALGYIRRFVDDRALAEEVLVDAMLSVWLGASEFRAGSRVSTWMLGIARHKALDALRRANVRDTTLRRAHALQVPLSSTTPPDVMQAAERKRTTLRAMAHLSDRHREVLHLAYFEDLDYSEISARLDVPVNTIKTRVFHAKRELHRCLLGDPSSCGGKWRGLSRHGNQLPPKLPPALATEVRA